MKKFSKKDELRFLRHLLEMAANPQTHLQSIHLDLTDAGIEYAFTGGVALVPHNYPRMTEDVDIIVSQKTSNNLEQLIGRGYTLRPGASGNMFLHVGGMRVPIDVIIEGQNKSGVIAPNPVKIRQKISGVWYVSLPALIELKVGSTREKDKDDVKRLIEFNDLTPKFVLKLRKPFRDAFLGLF